MAIVVDQSRSIIEHVGLWSEEEYLALPPGGPRIELVDGSLLVSPAPSSVHQRICRRLANALERLASDDLEVIEGVNLRAGPGRLLIPDVLVTRESADQVFEAAHALMVVEVVSPSNTGVRWQEKHALYAAAGIPWFLLAETDVGGRLGLTLLELDGDAYVEKGKAAEDEALALPVPGFSGSINPADLLRRRP